LTLCSHSGWRGRGIGGKAWGNEARRAVYANTAEWGGGIGAARAVVNKTWCRGHEISSHQSLSTLPCRARIANRPPNQVRRSPARWPTMGGFAGSFTLDRTWATGAYGREDQSGGTFADGVSAAVKCHWPARSSANVNLELPRLRGSGRTVVLWSRPAR
jgi:hypothetical protein